MTALTRQQLQHYILKDIPEPEDPEEQHQWLMDRIDVIYCLQASVDDLEIWEGIKSLGWDPDSFDPKSAYDKIIQYFQEGEPDSYYTTMKELNIRRAELDFHYTTMKELMNIRRADYDSMESFQSRLNYLRTTLNRSDHWKQSDTVFLWAALKGVEGVYSDLYNRNYVALSAGELTWTTLMAQFRRLALEETRQSSLTSIKFEKKKKNNNKGT